MNALKQNTKITVSDINTLISECNGKLNLSGGTITGKLYFTGSYIINNKAGGEIRIVCSEDEAVVGRTALILFERENSNYPGYFYLRSADATKTTDLIGKPDGTLTWGGKNVLTTGSVVNIANGGTGSSTKNFVDLSSEQTIAGLKTFSDGQKFISVSGQTVDVGTLFSTTTGVVKHYWSATDGGTSNITGLPSKNAFVLISYTYRYISATDYWVEQQLYQAGKTYRQTVRNGNASGWSGMWVA